MNNNSEDFDGLVEIWYFVKNHIIAIVIFYYCYWPIQTQIIIKILGENNFYLSFFVSFIIDVAISRGIEKAIIKFFNFIRYGNFKGKVFLVIGIAALLFTIFCAYAIWADNKMYIEMHYDYNKRVTELKEATICCISSAVITIFSGGIFIAKNLSKKHQK